MKRQRPNDKYPERQFKLNIMKKNDIFRYLSTIAIRRYICIFIIVFFFPGPLIIFCQQRDSLTNRKFVIENHNWPDNEMPLRHKFKVIESSSKEFMEVRRYNDSISRAISDIQIRVKQNLRPASVFIPDKSRDVGEIPMNSSVSPSGALSISIPIESFPGPKGISPQITLEYNSQREHGMAGYGWSIGGISSIGTVNKTLYYDGQVSPVKPTKEIAAEDALILDGNRVVSTDKGLETVSGNTLLNMYGYTYYARHPDGAVAEYDKRYGSSYKECFITRLTNRNGEWVDYNYYQESNGRAFIRSIRYFRDAASIEFEYTRCPYQIGSYRVGLEYRMLRCLKKIRTKFKGHVIREYELFYRFKDGFLFLDKVECSNAEGQRLNPLRFEYGYKGPKEGFFEQRAISHYGYHNPDPHFLVTKKGKMNFGRSGMDDVLLHYSSGLPYYYYEKSGGWFSHSKRYYINTYEDDQKIFICTGLRNIFPPRINPLIAGGGFIDILFSNLDGCFGDEIVKINAYVESGREKLVLSNYSLDKKEWQLKLISSKVFDLGDAIEHNGRESCWPKDFFSADIDGDGKDEIIGVAQDYPLEGPYYRTHVYVFKPLENSYWRIEPGFSFSKLNIGNKTEAKDAEQYSDKLFLTDVNSDGKSEIVLIKYDKTYTFEFHKSSNGTYSIRPYGASDAIKRDDIVRNYYTLGDFNADGLVDIFLTKGNEKGIYLCCGDGNYKYTSFRMDSWDIDENSGIAVCDIDSDGFSDFIHYSYSGLYDPRTTDLKFYINERTAFRKLDCDKRFTDKGNVIPTNINTGHYYSNILFFYSNKFEMLVYNTNGKRNRLLSGICSSMGVRTDIDYGMMYNGGDLYTNSGFLHNDNTYVSQQMTKDDYPHINLNANIFMVSGLRTYQASGRISDLKYQYNTAVIHCQGLGFTGFRKIKTLDLLSGRYQNLHFNPCRFGVPEHFENGQLEKDFRYKIVVDQYKRRLICQEYKKEVDKLHKTTVTTSRIYDNYGFPLREHMNFGSEIRQDKTFSYRHVNKEKLYLLGLPLKTTTIFHRGSGSIRKMTNYTYDKTERMSECTDYSESSEQKKTYYTYDGNGNITELRVRKFASPHILSTKYSYDSYERKVLETDPFGNVLHFDYDDNALGLLSINSDKRGNSTHYSYDGWGRLKQVRYPDFSSAETEYAWNNSHGCSYSIKETETNRPDVTTYYTENGREMVCETKTFDGRKRLVSKTYDPQGHLESESLPYYSGQKILKNTYSYDEFDRLLRIAFASGNTVSYAYSGNSIEEMKNGISIKRTYDAVGNLISSHDAAGTTTYVVRPDGLPERINAPGGSITILTYDIFGRRTSITDPSAGRFQTEYDAAGNISRETNGNGKSVTMKYDGYGRLISKTNAEQIVTVYDYNQFGDLIKENSGNGCFREFGFDALGRLTDLRETIVDGNWLRTSYTYDRNNLQAVEYTTSEGRIGEETYIYKNGYHTGTRWDGTDILWELRAEHPTGLSVVIQTGPVKREYTYDAFGTPTERKAMYTQLTLYEQTYRFDLRRHNLMERADRVHYHRETFTYDAMNRLTGYGPHRVSYDFKGNVLQKSDAGRFIYNHPSNPYAITDIIPSSDSVPVRNRQVTYNSLMRPVTIVENAYTAAFTYEGAGERVKTHITKAGKPYLTRYYIGGCYERDILPGGVSERLYLGGDYYSAPIVATREGKGKWKLNYIIRDYQGSIMCIANKWGKAIAHYAYDPWGRRVHPSSHKAYAAGSEPRLLLGRGYTGHEHLDLFGLINMNARLYDPLLGRFLSPDPYVQMPDFSQNFNRYAYCLNNPLIYTDPSGEIIFTILSAIFCPALLPMAIQTDIGWISGGISSKQNGGSFGEGAFVGGVIGAINGALSMISPINIPLGDSGFGLSIAPQISVGTDGMGIGFNAGVGYDLGKGFTAGLNLGGTCYATAAGSGRGGFEGRIGYGLGYKNKHFQAGIGSSYFFSEETSQQTGQIYAGGGKWKLTYENDTWAPVPGLLSPGGPEKDKFRTAAMRFDITGGRLKGLNAGFYIFTGKSGDKKDNNFIELGNIYRMGVIYAGYGNVRIGYNSEKNIRGPIQNGFHDLFNYPRFKVLNIPDKLYWGYYSLNPYTLW